MSRSAFFDQYEPALLRQQLTEEPFDFLSGSEFALGGTFLTSKTRKRQEVDAYTLYNYLAVTRIAMKASQQKPMMGIVRDRLSDVRGGSRLAMRDKVWLQKYYGGRVIQSLDQEVEMLPQEHPLVELLNRVNPADWWGSFIFELFLFLELTGEAIIWMIPSNLRSTSGTMGLPVQLWVIPTQWVELIFERSGALKFYRVTPDANRKNRKDIPVEQIIHIKFKNPKNKLRGYSPSLAGGPWIDANEAIEESRIRTFSNAVTPSVWLKITSGEISPNDPILNKIKERWMQRASGVARSREPQVVPPGIDIDDTGNYKPREMDFHNSSPEVRDNILALRGVNKFIAGFTEGMNRAQVETALVHFCELIINPSLAMVAGAFQEFLIPLFDPRIRIWFPDCSPENREVELREMQFRFGAGGFTPNQVRSRFGDPVIDDPAYDTGYIAAGLVPLSMNSSDGLPGFEDEESSREAALEMYQGNGRPVERLEGALFQ